MATALRILVLSLALTTIFYVDSQAREIWADIGGVQLANDPSTTFLNLDNEDKSRKQYGSIWIQPQDPNAGHARVEVIDSGTGDEIVFRNIKITTNGSAVSNYTIKAWGVMSSGPSTPPTYYYTESVNGKFAGRAKPANDEIWVYGYVQRPPLANPVSAGSWETVIGPPENATTYLYHKVTCGPAACPNATFNKVQVPNKAFPDVSGQDRALKLEITFNLVDRIDELYLASVPTTDSALITSSASQGGCKKKGKKGDC